MFVNMQFKKKTIFWSKYYLLTEHTSQKLMTEFPSKTWNEQSLRRLLKTTEDTSSVDKHPRSARPAHCRECNHVGDLMFSQKGVPKTAARVITGTRKFDRGLSDLLHSELHWLDIYQRVQYKLGVTIYRCLQNRAPQYLVDCCVRTSDVSSRQRLRSANRRRLVVPRHRRSKFRRRSFSIAAPMVWNSFPDSLRGPNTEHWQLPIDIKDSPVRGATGHVAH